MYISESVITSRQDHEFLHGQFVSCVGTTVDDIESRSGQNNIVISCQIGNMPIQRQILVGGSRFANGQGNAKNGIGS